MSAQTEQTRSAVLRRTKVREPLCSAKNNVRHAGQRFRIINDGWPTPQPNDGRKGRPDAGDAALAFERLHQGRLFPDLIGASATMPINFKIATGTEDIFAEKSFGVCIGNRLLRDLEQIPILATNVDVAGL